jgi:hypothetical protein
MNSIMMLRSTVISVQRNSISKVKVNRNVVGISTRVMSLDRCFHCSTINNTITTTDDKSPVS